MTTEASVARSLNGGVGTASMFENERRRLTRRVDQRVHCQELEAGVDREEARLVVEDRNPQGGGRRQRVFPERARSVRADETCRNENRDLSAARNERI